ncbi:MAG: hypothetical protein HQL34_13475, partial [Alphaproteobacteria bacterium]|nr:hypothetical protein [Alphaproteobacteria bacterium]
PNSPKEATRSASGFQPNSICRVEEPYKRPGDIYRDDEELHLYFENFPGAWFVDEPLPDGVASDALWNRLGVMHRPRRIMFDGELPQEIKRRSTRPETVQNYKLDGFDSFIDTVKASDSFENRKRRSLVLWRYLTDFLRDDRSFFYGQYEWFYYSDRAMSFDSFMLTRLRQTEWIPTEDQSLEKPAGLSATDLCMEFRDADELMKLLRIKAEDQTEAVKKLQHASELGVSLDDVEFLKSHLEDFHAWKQSRAETANRPTFPVRTSADAARRETRVSEQWQDAVEKEYAPRERSVRTSRTAVEPHRWLIDYYTNDDRQMICQLCSNEMPFRKRNEEYYFVAMEALGREQFSREHHAQFLTLCPVCAAKYNEFVKSDDIALAAMKKAIIDADEPAIDVMLGTSAETLRFVEVHFDDLRTILREEIEATCD